jgi:predicted AlkP superfamily phosphohydrolase/phosphomutase
MSREPRAGRTPRVTLMRTVVIGLEGCSWNVLDALLETGELPNLEALRAKSATAVLESTIPFFTAPAWTSFVTGCAPGAHGIYDFMMLRDDGSLSVAAQDDVRRKTYYQQLGAERKRSVLINLPLDQGGCEGAVIVNSRLSDDSARQILPVGRRRRYARLLASYKTFPENPGDVEELCAIERARFDLARELFLAETWDHFFVLFSSTDWLGHSSTGAFLAGDEAARAMFLRLYKDIDRYIGWLVDHAPDAAVFVASDHGQCAEEAVLRVNTVLHELGLAEPAESGAQGDALNGNGPSDARIRVQVPPAVGRLRSKRAVGPAARFLKRAVRRGLGVDLVRATRPVDRTRSRAFCPTDASFAIYTRDLDADDIEQVRSALLSVRLPDGRAAVDGVWTTEELYGRQEGFSPTLVFAPASGVRPSATIKDEVVSPGQTLETGCHHRDGMLMLAGPNVRPSSLGHRSIYDVAPTLLWLMGCGIPDSLDGRVLFEAYDESFASVHPVRTVDGGWIEVDSQHPAASDEVARRLKALGYI